MKKFVICFLMLFTCATFVPAFQVEASPRSIASFDSDRPDIDVTDYSRDDNFESNCADFAKTIRIGGELIFLVKVLLPLVIIGKTTMDLATLVISGSSSELPKQTKKIGVSLVASIVIFFLPTLIYTVFGFIGGFDENRSDDSKICYACIFDPYSSDCTDYTQ